MTKEKRGYTPKKHVVYLYIKCGEVGNLFQVHWQDTGTTAYSLHAKKDK